MSVTPMMSQWHRLKAEAKDAILFFRLGDFYEAFYQDATLVAKEINLTLTARQNIPMCGVPFHAAETYIDKLIAKGYKIAIAEQTEDPKQAKGIVKREIVRILTPATVIQSELIDDKTNRFFVAIVSKRDLFALACLDLTTGHFQTDRYTHISRLLDELCRLKPKEFLAPESFPFFQELSHRFSFLVNEKPLMEEKSAYYSALLKHFHTDHLESFGLKEEDLETLAAGFLLLYLKKDLGLSLAQVQSIHIGMKEPFLSIDRSSEKSLEIEGALFSLLDQTLTPMGARMLKGWLKKPLIDIKGIEKRQREIEKALADKERFQRIRKALSYIRDIERLITKISTKYAGPKDVLALGQSLSAIPDVQREFEKAFPFDAEPLAKEILSTISPSAPIRAGEGDLFQEGYSKELDELKKIALASMSWVANYQMNLREKTGIKTLKVGFTKAFGYYIEISRSQSAKAPEFLQRRQTLVNAERFTTEELKSFEHRALSAEERAKAIEIELFESFREKIASYFIPIQSLAQKIAEIDSLLSLAKAADEGGWEKPTLDMGDRIEIIEGRHPIVEAVMGKAHFIANDTHLSPERQLMLITGPNMAGKSTYIRQVGLLVVLAQIGSFLPAKKATIGIVDQIFSRIGASDDIARGQSTFMVEMSETAHILQHVTSRSLVLLDEIGRGTSTYDGISIAWAVAEYLLTTPHKNAKTLFATHYWELTRLEKEFSHAANFLTKVEETDDGIVFLRKIVRGGTDKSYGIHVARLAGLPKKALKRAQAMLEELEEKKETQLALFEEKSDPHPILQELKALDIENTTPLLAHQILVNLQKKAAHIP